VRSLLVGSAALLSFLTALAAATAPSGPAPERGGPGGNFDWVVGNGSGGPPQTFILDTTYCVIVNEQQTVMETVIGGRVDVRNLTVRGNGVIQIQGPNPCVIVATGTITIDGQILAFGANNRGVSTLDTTDLPEPGGAGAAGGGAGGTGNWRTGRATEHGGNGFGAFDAAGRGGVGGESGYNPAWPGDQDDQHRRPGGGGGGTFGHDFPRPAGIVPGYTNPHACPDQIRNGLDAERGFDGYPFAVGAVSGLRPPPGGDPGPRPFTDGDPRNDFWGTMVLPNGGTLHGELAHPWAGAGGGAGGNAIVSNSFPEIPFSPTGDEKGAGGGGGGGSLTMFAVGSIVFGPEGRIDASGGTGGGGENSQAGDITHIGGGSGGGSGGHVVLESQATIDFSRCQTTSNPPAGIYALGGQGGAGKNNLGGATPGGIPTSPANDAFPAYFYPNTSSPCGVVAGHDGYTFSNSMDPDGPQVVICAGGDGGPGIVQLHVTSLDDILPPTAPGENIYKMIKPPPVQSLPAVGVSSYDRINRPVTWNRMVPQLGLLPPSGGAWADAGAPPVPTLDLLRLPGGF
jgi:hypothetical protein